MATRALYEARQQLSAIDSEFRQVTGALQERKRMAKDRLARAQLEEQRIREEIERLTYTLQSAFGIHLGQQSLIPVAPEGPKTTFIVKTSASQVRDLIRALRARLKEAPD